MHTNHCITDSACVCGTALHQLQFKASYRCTQQLKSALDDLSLTERVSHADDSFNRKQQSSVGMSCAAQAGMYDTDTGLYCLTLDSQIQIKRVHIELLLDSFPLVGACPTVTALKFAEHLSARNDDVTGVPATKMAAAAVPMSHRELVLLTASEDKCIQWCRLNGLLADNQQCPRCVRHRMKSCCIKRYVLAI